MHESPAMGKIEPLLMVSNNPRLLQRNQIIMRGNDRKPAVTSCVVSNISRKLALSCYKAHQILRAETGTTALTNNNNINHDNLELRNLGLKIRKVLKCIKLIYIYIYMCVCVCVNLFTE